MLFHIYFYDTSNSDPHAVVEFTLVEANTKEEAIKIFHKEFDDCVIRNILEN